MNVHFAYADRKLSIKNKNKVKAFVAALADYEGRSIDSLTYVFCSDDYLLGINQQFLEHDYYTDIITFDLGIPGSNALTGEVYISVDRVRENAAGLLLSFEEEVLRVIFHGALHLCGYGDKNKSESAVMRQKEDAYLRLYAEFNP